jgi:DNA replication protein DnaC
VRRLNELLERLERRFEDPVSSAGSAGSAERSGDPAAEPAACDLPGGHHCSGTWHWRDDGGAGSAYERCPRAVERRRQAAAAQVPGEQTFETFEALLEPDGFRAARRWAADCGAGEAPLALLRTGSRPNTGCGKSHLLRAAARELTRAGRWVELATAWDLTAAVRGRALYDAAERAAAEVAAKRWIACEALLLDDLGQEETAPAPTAGFLIGLLEERAGRQGRGARSLAFATNLTEPELTQRYGAALASRLLAGALVPDLQGRDYRRRRQEQP